MQVPCRQGQMPGLCSPSPKRVPCVALSSTCLTLQVRPLSSLHVACSDLQASLYPDALPAVCSIRKPAGECGGCFALSGCCREASWPAMGRCVPRCHSPASLIPSTSRQSDNQVNPFGLSLSSHLSMTCIWAGSGFKTDTVTFVHIMQLVSLDTWA